MQISRLVLSSLLWTLSSGLMPGVAQGDLTGESSRCDFHVGREHVLTASAKWSFETLLGEVCRKGTFRYTTASGRRLPWDTFLVLEVALDTKTSGYISLRPERVPASGGSYARCASGSPPWKRLIARCVRDGQLTDYLDGAAAKSAFTKGLKVRRWHLVSRYGSSRGASAINLGLRREGDLKGRTAQAEKGSPIDRAESQLHGANRAALRRLQARLDRPRRRK